MPQILGLKIGCGLIWQNKFSRDYFGRFSLSQTAPFLRRNKKKFQIIFKNQLLLELRLIFSGIYKSSRLEGVFDDN